MFLDEFLRSHGVDFTQLCCLVREYTQITDDEILYATGSLVEGLGNHRSDVDVYLVSDRDLADRCTVGSIIILPLSSCTIDIEVVSSRRIDDLIRRLSQYPPEGQRDPRRSALAFSPGELKLLHNLVIGIPINVGNDSFQALRSRIDPRAISRCLFDYNAVLIDVLHTDILGLLESGDFYSARSLIGNFLFSLAGAFLAVLGNTNPAEKWRVAKLLRFEGALDHAGLPGGLSISLVAEQLRGLHVDCAPTASGVWSYFRRVVRLSNYIIPWGQRKFVAHTEDGHPTLPPIKSVSHVSEVVCLRDSSDSLPSLTAECRIHYDPEGYRLWRVGSAMTVTLNELAYELILQFDGNTRLGSAVEKLVGPTGETRTRLSAAANDLKDVLQQRGFIFESYV